MTKRPLEALLLIIIVSIATTSNYASNSVDQPTFKATQEIAQEIAHAKEHFPDIALRYTIKNSSVQALLNKIDKSSIIEKETSLRSRIMQAFFMHVFLPLI